VDPRFDVVTLDSHGTLIDQPHLSGIALG